MNACAGSNLAWISVDNLPTYSIFEALFQQCRLHERFGSLIDHDTSLRMYSAFFVVRSHCESPNLHVDYVHSVGVTAMTLITPLDDYASRCEGFQLLYLNDARQRRRYTYRKGKAIAFGSSFTHSTEPGRSLDEPCVMLCFTFGTDKQVHWPAIAQTIDGKQSRTYMQPCGALVLSQLGRQLAGSHPAEMDQAVERVAQ